MSHLVQLVDTYDNFIGYKQRDEILPNEIMRFISVNILDGSGQYVLVQKRSIQKKTFPGLWTNGVMWVLEVGDTYLSGALREIQEEIGVSRCELQEHGVSFLSNDSGGGLLSMLFSAHISLDTQFSLQESEVDEVKWLSIEDLRTWIEKSPEDFTARSIDTWRILGII